MKTALRALRQGTPEFPHAEKKRQLERIAAKARKREPLTPLERELLLEWRIELCAKAALCVVLWMWLLQQVLV